MFYISEFTLIDYKNNLYTIYANDHKKIIQVSNDVYQCQICIC